MSLESRRAINHWKVAPWLWALPLAGALLLTGCTGFKIRGFDLGLAFERVSVQGAGAVAEEIRQVFSGHPKIQIVKKTVEAQAVVYVTSERLEQTVIAFSSGGRPREIELRLRVSFRVTDGFAVELYPPTELTQSRTLSVPENEVLINTASEQLLREDMQRDIANQIIRRLRAVKISS